MTTRLPLLLCALVCLLGTMVPGQTSPTLLLVAADHGGEPVPGVKFAVVGERGERRIVETGPDGRARSELAHTSEQAAITLDDERWISLQSPWESTPEDRIGFFRLYRRDASEMTRAERRAFANDALGFVMRDPWQAPDAGDYPPAPVPATARRLSMFFPPHRVESAVNGLADFQADHLGVVSVRILDGRGRPVDGALVRLFYFNETGGILDLAGTERTAASGIAVFDAAPANHLCRAEAVDGALQAVSGFIQVTPGGETLVGPIVLRSPGDRVTGLVFDGDTPVAGALVTARDPGGGRVMSTTTDQFGYFEVAPLPAETVNLRVQHASEKGVRRFNTTVRGGGSLFIPIDMAAD